MKALALSGWIAAAAAVAWAVSAWTQGGADAAPPAGDAAEQEAAAEAAEAVEEKDDDAHGLPVDRTDVPASVERPPYVRDDMKPEWYPLPFLTSAGIGWSSPAVMELLRDASPEAKELAGRIADASSAIDRLVLLADEVARCRNAAVRLAFVRALRETMDGEDWRQFATKEARLAAAHEAMSVAKSFVHDRNWHVREAARDAWFTGVSSMPVDASLDVVENLLSTPRAMKEMCLEPGDYRDDDGAEAIGYYVGELVYAVRGRFFEGGNKYDPDVFARTAEMVLNVEAAQGADADVARTIFKEMYDFGFPGREKAEQCLEWLTELDIAGRRYFTEAEDLSDFAGMLAGVVLTDTPEEETESDRIFEARMLELLEDTSRRYATGRIALEAAFNQALLEQLLAERCVVGEEGARELAQDLSSREEEYARMDSLFARERERKRLRNAAKEGGGNGK